jgi:hypothetical protein
MKLDLTTHDALIQIAGDSHKGLWASQAFSRTSKFTVRTAGQLPTSASLHTLEIVALTTALRSITKGMAAKLIQPGMTKPRILVGTSDASFAGAISGLLVGDRTAPLLRAGRNFLSIAAYQLARFNVEIRTPETGDTAILVLKGWAQNHVTDPKVIKHIPGLEPSAVSQVCGFTSLLSRF